MKKEQKIKGLTALVSEAFQGGKSGNRKTTKVNESGYDTGTGLGEPFIGVQEYLSSADLDGEQQAVLAVLDVEDIEVFCIEYDGDVKMFLGDGQDVLDEWEDEDQEDYGSLAEYIDGQYSDIFDEVNVGDYYGDRNSYLVDGNDFSGEYRVFDNYDSAEAAAVEFNLDLFDDIGLEGMENLIPSHLDEDKAKEIFEESAEFYYNDMSAEEIAEEKGLDFDDYAEEAGYDEDDEDDDIYNYDWDDVDSNSSVIDDAREELIEQMVDNYMYDVLDSLNEMGIDAKRMEELGLINLEDMAQEIVDLDGVANSLAGYDGDEHEVNIQGTDFYIYRTN